MANTMPDVEVMSPPVAPYSFGLFSIVPTNLPDRSWQDGVWWRSRACGQQVGITNGPCSIDTAVPALTALTGLCTTGTAAGFDLYALSEGTSGGTRLVEESYRYAEDMLQAGEQYTTEAQMWALLLAANAAADATAKSVTDAIAIGEELMASVYGGTPVFHLGRGAATYGLAERSLVTSGTRLSTALGSPAVAGGGYGAPATTPGAARTIYVTGAVILLRGAVEPLGQTFAYRTNTPQAVVHRPIVVGWDCASFRIDISAAP